MGKNKEELEAEYTPKPLQQQGVTAQSNAERSENIITTAGSEANKIPANIGGAPTTAFGEKIDSYAHLARTTVDARNRANKAEDEKEEKRLKAMRTLGTISNVVGGIGNLIAANAGAAPIKQDTSLLDEAKKGYADLLERKRKRANEDLEMLYSARSKDIKDARAEREAEKEAGAKASTAQMAHENKMKEMQTKAEYDKELAGLKAEYNLKMEEYKQTGNIEKLKAANQAKERIENLKQNRADQRTIATQAAINARTNANNKSRYGSGAVSVESQMEGIPTEEEKKEEKGDFDLD